MAIQSVQRALTILTLFTQERTRLGITEISHLMNLPKPTIHGLVQTLINNGFLVQDKETRKYSLGLKIYELGIFLSGTLKVNQVGGAAAQRLSKETGHMVRVAIWDRDMVLITMNLFPTVDDTYLFQQLGLGPRVPAYCSAVGKAILAKMSREELDAYIDRTEFESFTGNTVNSRDALVKDLDTYKANGFTSECEEYLNGLACIGVPVYDSSGGVSAAISLSGSADFLNDPDLDKKAAKLVRTAGEISIGMGCPPSMLVYS